jgi:hypothetical protein
MIHIRMTGVVNDAHASSSGRFSLNDEVERSHCVVHSADRNSVVFIVCDPKALQNCHYSCHHVWFRDVWRFNWYMSSMNMSLCCLRAAAGMEMY